MADFKVIFNNNSMPPFVKVANVINTVLPPVSQNTITVPGRYGAIPFGNELGARLISIEVILFSDALDNMPFYARQLAQWLYYTEPKRLELQDNVGKYYMAMFTGDSSIEELFSVGRTTLNFTCYDPLQYGDEMTVPINTTDVTKVSNLGTAPSYPIIKFKVNKNLTGLTVVGSDDYVDIGSPLTVDDTSTDYEPYALKDYLTSFGGWTQSSGVPGATVNVALSEWEIWDNSVFRIREAWKDASGWHGGAIEKQFTKSVQDFECIVPVHFNGKQNRGRGNIQTNIKTLDGGYLMRISYKDGSLTATECAVTVDLFNSSGDAKNVFSYKIPAKYQDFVGCVYASRRGNKWTFILRRKVGEGGRAWATSTEGLQTLKTGYYTDSSKTYMKQANVIQLVLLSYDRWEDNEGSKNDKLRNYMSIYNVFIKNLEKYTPQANKIPTIIYSGDEITVNCRTGEVFKNDDYFMDFLNPNSTFICFDQKNNALQIIPEGSIESGEVIVQPSWY